MDSTPKRILITGASGYLGSCTAEWFRRQGALPIGIDNFSTSKKRSGLSFDVLEADLSDFEASKKTFEKVAPLDAVIHFAAYALVGESCAQPYNYFYNNILSSLNVAELCVRFHVPFLIHSSSCATYGMPSSSHLKEDNALSPLSPYGETKRINEQLFSQYQQWTKLRTLNLRYFNPAGAFLDAGLGERHEPETHLIPSVINAARNGKHFKIFGNDYSTPDGTCIRDLIHVRDLAEAHWRAYQYLRTAKEPVSFLNIGTGEGVSVQQVVTTAQKILPAKVRTEVAPRRDGDAPRLVADTSLMKSLLGWSPKFSVSDMLMDHWNFIDGST